MVDKIENLDNLIKKLNLILSNDKRFENEINYDYYLKKMSKQKEIKQKIEIPIKFLPEYNIEFTKNNNNINQYKEKYNKLLKEIEILINNISTSSLDTSLLLSKLNELKTNSLNNLRELQNL
jgi:hypothetical protein